MKRTLLVLLCLGAWASQAQSITEARFTLSPRGDNFRTIELELNGSLLVGLTGHGVLQYVTTVDGDPLPLLNAPRSSGTTTSLISMIYRAG